MFRHSRASADRCLGPANRYIRPSARAVLFFFSPCGHPQTSSSLSASNLAHTVELIHHSLTRPPTLPPMSRLAVASVLLAQVLLALSVPSQTPTLVERAVAYYDPNANGGSMLDDAGSGGGEPLNVSLILPSTSSLSIYDSLARHLTHAWYTSR